MTPMESWLLIAAVFGACCGFLWLLDFTGARVQAWLLRVTDRSPAGPASGNSADVIREETAGDRSVMTAPAFPPNREIWEGDITRAFQHQPVSFGRPAKKGIQRRHLELIARMGDTRHD